MVYAQTAENALCADCAATAFLKGIDVFMLSIELRGPEILLAPHVQAQFSQIMKVGKADAAPEEIDWQRVVDNWELPMPKGKRRK